MKTALLILVIQAAAFAQTPTLAEVARQERARQKATPSSVTLTNDTLRKSDAGTPAPTTKTDKTDKATTATGKPSEPLAKPEAKTTDARPHDEAWWRDAFKQARSDVKRGEDRAKTLELELNQLNKDLLTRSDIYNREGVYGPQIRAKNADLAAAKRDTEQARERIMQLEEDLRRAWRSIRLVALMVFLGIDGGGSKTAFLLEDEAGNVLDRIETGPSNWLSAGGATAHQNIAAGLQQLKVLPDIVCGGFAGAGRPEGIAFYTATLTRLLPAAQVFVETDAFIAYIGAIGLEPGVLLIAGTGSIAIGRRADGAMIRVGGWGPIFSDEGSGFWIGREAIRYALRYHDAGTHPEFVASIREALGLDSITEVSAAWKSARLPVRSVASLAALLFAKHPAETATLRIVETAAAHLGEIAKTAMAQVGLPNCRLSIAGSIGRHAGIRKMTGMEFDDPAHPPERGAIIWARSQSRH